MCIRDRYIPLGQSILGISFLFPPDNDEDRLVLVLLVESEGRIYVQYIDWSQDDEKLHHQLGPPQRLSLAGNQIPRAVIPLYGTTAFLILRDFEITKHTNFLSGHAEQQTVMVSTAPMEDSVPWATSAVSLPGIYTNTTIFFVKANGAVFQTNIDATDPAQETKIRFLHSLDCQVDRAFACYENAIGLISLVACGEHNAGSVMIKALDSLDGDAQVKHEDEEHDAAAFSSVQHLPNWSPSIDLISSNLPHGREMTPRRSESLFTTSGRQPYGNVNELRYGLRARMSTVFSMDEFRGCTRVWALPIEESDELILLLTVGDITQGAVSYTHLTLPTKRIV